MVSLVLVLALVLQDLLVLVLLVLLAPMMVLLVLVHVFSVLLVQVLLVLLVLLVLSGPADGLTGPGAGLLVLPMMLLVQFYWC